MMLRKCRSHVTLTMPTAAVFAVMVSMLLQLPPTQGESMHDRSKAKKDAKAEEKMAAVRAEDCSYEDVYANGIHYPQYCKRM